MTTQALFLADAYLRETGSTVIAHTPEGGIVVDRSVFYATSGGQPGDSGQIDWTGGRLAIATAVKVEGGLIALVPSEPLALWHADYPAAGLAPPPPPHAHAHRVASAVGGHPVASDGRPDRRR